MESKYYHVDVFSKNPFSGNGLTIFPDVEKLDKEIMKLLTQEMRQFESIFFYALESNRYRAFIFTMEEELDFAGHPLLGLASIIHDVYYTGQAKNEVTIELNTKSVDVVTSKKDGFYTASMNQGTPSFLHSLNNEEQLNYLNYLGLSFEDKMANLSLEVITTGLPYLIVPVKSSSLLKVKVSIPDLESKLAEIGAKFFYVLDVQNKRGRTWDNSGWVEDIATGSSAGPVGAYLVKNGHARFNSQIKLSQGEFLNRASELRVLVSGNDSVFENIHVEGDVVKIAEGKIVTNANIV